jgi:hypothetical protein
MELRFRLKSANGDKMLRALESISALGCIIALEAGRWRSAEAAGTENQRQ